MTLACFYMPSMGAGVGNLLEMRRKCYETMSLEMLLLQDCGAAGTRWIDGSMFEHPSPFACT